MDPERDGLAPAVAAAYADFAQQRPALYDAMFTHAVDLTFETFWAGLHGLAMLERSGRLPLEARDHRLELLVGRFAPVTG
ncbi:hypothetical protein ACQEVI_09665 [Promicromonospora sp. CA-289599]|uniref:hypothetical protein n=1 Tax=Promicromonospora sp. CA-289599 TaxID=3240014 RepID=UPI003D8E12F5